jgi:ABC-type phosphonate transport system ATPase subunit
MVLLLNDVDIDYEVWEDRQRGLRERFTGLKGAGRDDHPRCPGRQLCRLRGRVGCHHGLERIRQEHHPGRHRRSATGDQRADLRRLRTPADGRGRSPVAQGVGIRNIRIGCLALGMSLEQIDEHMDSIIEFADIGDAINRPLRSYSSGMKARLLFAIATSIRPKILMIDEALSVGDKEFRAKSEGRIQEMLDHAGTLLMVSHNMNELKRLCKRGIWLEQGVLKADGPIADVIAQYTEKQK